VHFLNLQSGFYQFYWADFSFLPSGFSITTEQIFHFYWGDFPFLLSGFSIFPRKFSILPSEFFNFTERAF
jgi:hypothetical protein